jgi:hypothetical protein
MWEVALSPRVSEVSLSRKSSTSQMFEDTLLFNIHSETLHRENESKDHGKPNLQDTFPFIF